MFTLKTVSFIDVHAETLCVIVLTLLQPAELVPLIVYVVVIVGETAMLVPAPPGFQV